MLPGEDEQTLVSHEYIWQLLRRPGRTPDDLEIFRAVLPPSRPVRRAAQHRVSGPSCASHHCALPLTAPQAVVSWGKSIGSLPTSPATSSQRPRPYGQVSR